MSAKKNAINLYIIQGTNILVPLLALPYLGRALGPDGFGSLAFAQLILQYLILTADFGFNLTATRRISQAKGDKNAISTIVVNTSIVRIALGVFACLVTYAATLVIPQLNSSRHIILISFAAVAGSILTPAWLFHGLEKNHIFAAITALPRFAALIPLATLIKTPADLTLAAWLQFGPQLATGLICVIWISYSKPFPLCAPKISQIKFAFSDGLHIYTSTILSSIYIYVNGLIVRFAGGEAALGIYAAAEKLVKAVSALISPVVQAVYPRVCNGSNHSLKKIYLIIIAITLSCWLGSLAIGDLIISLVYGPHFHESSTVLKILTVAPIFSGMSMISVQLKILAWGEHKHLKKIYALSVLMHCAQAPILVTSWGVRGAAISVVITEILTLTLISAMVRKLAR